MGGIKEIAKMTGVSLATVSRVFNNSALVSPKTREKVLKAAKDIDYRPNVMAAALRSGKSKIIGVIVPEVNNSFFSDIINGIEGVVSDSGFNIIISQTHEKQERENAALNSLLELNVDGILMSISKETKDYTQIQKIIDSKTPIVFFDRRPTLDAINAVLLNNYLGAYIATEHLIDMDCENILHIAGNPDVSIFEERKKGFVAAAQKHRVQYLVNHLPNIKSNPEEDLNSLKDILKKHPNIDGIFAYGDEMAIHLLNLLNTLKIEVPKQVKLIGFGNANFSALTQPSLSSIDQESSLMGELSANLLLQNLKRKTKPTAKVLSPKLIRRESTKNLDQ
ncbi:LacI family DNA-binding transcriptional regulator [Flagellimonas meridianipacifica]|uniref:LacI family transcriptional regulator n=1 Tax=Flagellimonas meridianipacifica TaxID=1080225 RepID=A0A2T0MFY5_9FLAO|nr:LacI family DNA-binding transcriptional regulator [Allomuricauda pacifica]PRX56490.1 LacI family transcriptional regulator [Allomuricauda pacifica]